MNVKSFATEEWMNAYETSATYNNAETCVDSLTLNEWITIDGTNPDEFLHSLREKKLTYGHKLI